MELKVCGMKLNTREVAKLRPDYLGFIFWRDSSRFFDGEIPSLPPQIQKVGVFVDASVEEIIEKIKKYDLQGVQLHGKEEPDFCKELRIKCNESAVKSSEVRVGSGRLGHQGGGGHATSSTPPKLGNGSIGNARSGAAETSDPTTATKETTLKIIKVFSIKDSFDFSLLEPYEDVCDYYLFDTKGKLPGGNGYAFDWKVLQNYPSTKPYFLSGGIGSGDVGSIKSFLQRPESKYCHAIDVNSRFEIEPGLKDVGNLKEFREKLQS